ncbi:MAG: hypothetical protein AAGB22_00010 [Bacteroidota bacterium]
MNIRLFSFWKSLQQRLRPASANPVKRLRLTRSRLGIGTLCLTLVLQACQQAPLPPNDYVNWVQEAENGLRVGKDLNGYRFELQYRPAELIALQEQGPATDLPTFTERVEALEGMQYFTLHITPETGGLLDQDIQSEQEYYTRLDYFNSFMQQDLWLIDGRDTLACKLHHYENTNGLRPDHQFVLAFEQGNSPTTEAKTLLFDDRVLGNGPVRLTIAKNDLLAIPDLTL